MKTTGNALLLAALLLIVGATQADPVRLIFAGDIMLDDGPGRVIASGRDPLAHFSAILSNADFTLGNLECPIATGGKALESKIFSFRARAQVLPLLKGRFDALAVSNNHSGDYGKEAFLETLSLLEHSAIPYFGGGRDLAAAHAPLWIDRQGLRIAALGYNEFKPRSFEAGADWPGIAWSEDSQVVADIRAARAAGADLVVPFMHWGWEREPQPSERQRQLARLMIDAGADVVVGGHPHVTQGAEYYRGRLIVYSLGNFVFDGFELPEAKRGWLLRLTVDRHGLVSWDTLAAQMDEEGTPHPVPGARTPCGKAGDASVGLCENP
jgi:poly-gamma-glutamate synthesis protein (capsule biosynthesis protein)